MELAVLFDHRFYRSPGQAIYSPTSYSYTFFQKRYLSVFDSVSILARVDEVPGGGSRDCEPTEGPSVKVIDLGEWTGAGGFLKSRRQLVREVEWFMDRGAAFVMLGPGALTWMVFMHLVRKRYAFALEVVGDPWEAYSPGACSHPLRPVLRQWGCGVLRRQCQLADAALYVTRHVLQERYPCGGLTAGISDVVLPPEAFVAAQRTFNGKNLTVISVGGMAQLYKGQDLLIDAVGICIRSGLDVRLVLVGDGRHRRELESRVVAAGIASRVRFAGEVSPASAVRAELDRADLFVLPSRAEGLPRALVEAMARALPCVGTDVGGIPELLRQDDLVVPRDSAELARRISEVASDRGRMAEMSLRNWRKAAEYEEGTLVAGRTDFYRQVRQLTEERLAANSRVRNGRPVNAPPVAGSSAGL